MTVFSGAFSGHRWRLPAFKRHQPPPQPPQPPPPPPMSQSTPPGFSRAEEHHQAFTSISMEDEVTHAGTIGGPATATSAVVEALLPPSAQAAAPSGSIRGQRHNSSNASNSTVHTSAGSQQHQLASARAVSYAAAISAATSAAGSIGSGTVHRPPRRQIIIPGDTQDAAAKSPSDEEADDRDAESRQAKPPESNECPTGKHKNKKDQLCSCILLLRFNDKVATPVISEWHSAAAVSSGNGGPSSAESAAAAAATTAAAPVALSEFKLARNRVFQGGQGVVYIVRRRRRPNLAGGLPLQEDSTVDEELVMKFKERRRKQRTKSWKRDLREVFLLKDLRHPFIIDLKHAYLTDTFYCLVMDYGSRGSLWSLVCRHGCMPKSIAAYYVACILSAVRYVHKNNFIFRDLKAENVVVMPDMRPKLIDFGMAKSHNKPSVRNTSTSFYFAAYIAPEVYADPKGVDEKVDSWGIGYLALELTVGLGVFKSLPWSQTKHTAPDWRFEMPKRYAGRLTRDASRFIEKALDRRPEKRPSLDQLMDFQFLEDVDFRLLPALKPKGMETYLTKKATET